MKILEPITVKNTTFKNRIMFPPLTTGYEAKDGSISSQSRAFYTRLAKGGTGYIVLGDVAPIRSFSPTPKLFDDSQIESFQRLSDSVHEYGAKLGVQIFHPEYDCDALNALFAQGKMEEARKQLHHDMEHFTDEVSEETLLSIIDKMCACALRAQEAGVDVIQVHGDRLAGTLCSTKMNHRKDAYGGSLENRTRFALMLVHKLRETVPDMLIDYKLAIVTPQRGKGGIDAQDAVEFAQRLQDAGVDMLHVAQANHTGNMADTIPPMGVQPYGFFVHLAGQVKDAVSIPVSAVGRILDPYMAERIVESNMADMIGLGRPLLADPDWVNKAAEGKGSEIRRCISCNKGCTDMIQNRQFLSCILNAENGYEETRRIVPADRPQNVVIAGAGPAGLEAARVAALKGHRVTLFEKEMKAGGQLNIACVPPRKDEMKRALHFLENAVKAAGVTLRMGEEADCDNIVELNPDAVIIAAGAKSASLPIPGIDGPNVCDAWKVLEGTRQVYGRVAVIGGGMAGCETAEYLAGQGCQVSVVEVLDKIAQGEGNTVLPTMMENFKRVGIEVYTGHTVKEITMDALVCQTKDRVEVKIYCDYAVLAAGARPVDFEDEKLKNLGIPVFRIGDCMEKASDISNAIKSGYDAANGIG